MPTGYLAPVPRQRWFSDLGVVLPGAKLWTYQAGTPSTPIVTYSDEALTVPNTNPILASAGGLFGPIYLTAGVGYKFLLLDQFDVAVPGFPQDHIMVPAGMTLAAGSGISLVTVGGVTTITASGPTLASIGVNDFRLTLESGVPVSPTDQLAKTTLYCTPIVGNRLDLYDAAGVPTTRTSAQFSIALPAAASQLYDVFCYSNAGVPTLELLAWTSDTTRATALTLATTGTYTKAGDLTRRYLGTVRTTTVAGQSEDSLVKRYLWNYYHRAPRPLQRFEPSSSWSYTTATVRQANGAAANQVEIVVGVADTVIDLSLVTMVANSAAGVFVGAGIGEDTTTAYTVGALNVSPTTGAYSVLTSRLVKIPAVGRHVYAWNEYSQATGTTTWLGANVSGGSVATAGLSGEIAG